MFEPIKKITAGRQTDGYVIRHDPGKMWRIPKDTRQLVGIDRQVVVLIDRERRWLAFRAAREGDNRGIIRSVTANGQFSCHEATEFVGCAGCSWVPIVTDGMLVIDVMVAVSS